MVWKKLQKIKGGLPSEGFFNVFHSSHFCFWLLVTFDKEVTKILHNLCFHFARQDGKKITQIN